MTTTPAPSEQREVARQFAAYPWDGATAPLPLTRLYPHEVTRTEYRTGAA